MKTPFFIIAFLLILSLPFNNAIAQDSPAILRQPIDQSVCDYNYAYFSVEATGKAFEQKSEAYMIAKLIKESRKKTRLTQEQLANKINVNRAYISKIERASNDIRISTLRKIIETGLGEKLHINVEL